MQKLFTPSLERALRAIHALGGYDSANDPAPVMRGRMVGDGDAAQWVESSDQLQFRGLPVWRFVLSLPAISPLTGQTRLQNVAVDFPAPSAPSFADMTAAPADGGSATVDDLGWAGVED